MRQHCRRLIGALCAVVASTAVAGAQRSDRASVRPVSRTMSHDEAGPSTPSSGLAGKLSELFRFGSSTVQLFLPGTADPANPVGIQAHGSHFIPSAVESNGAMITFIQTALASGASSIPVASTGGGTTFGFENGMPVATSISPGPIFAERAQTLGRGRASVGFNRTHTSFVSIRGVPMNDLRLVFTHQNVTGAELPGCDSIYGTSCNKFGVPTLENEVMRVTLNLSLDATVTSLFFSYGLTNNIDIAVAVPFVETSLSGTSTARIDPFGGTTASHFFAGTYTNPVLSASTSSSGSAQGIGDVTARIKVHVGSGPKASFAMLIDTRFPTGSADDLLGSGSYAGRVLAILSARFEAFSPHANVGYLARGGKNENDGVLATVGFDQVLASWATIAADLVSEFQVGENKAHLPTTATYDSPFVRTVDLTTIPNTRDDLINASFGAKLRVAENLNAVANLMIPLNRGGMRPNTQLTLGAEYNF